MFKILRIWRVIVAKLRRMRFVRHEDRKNTGIVANFATISGRRAMAQREWQPPRLLDTLLGPPHCCGYSARQETLWTNAQNPFRSR